jgi:hypothetical protein
MLEEIWFVLFLPFKQSFAPEADFWYFSEQCFVHAVVHHWVHPRNQGRTSTFCQKKDSDSHGFPQLAQEGDCPGLINQSFFLEDLKFITCFKLQ